MGQIHIENSDISEVGESRDNCDCEYGTYCGDELYLEDGLTLCGLEIGIFKNDYENPIRWTWEHWISFRDTKQWLENKEHCEECKINYLVKNRFGEEISNC